MTCIVGYISKHKIIIGADSAGVSGLNLTPRKDSKVFEVDEFIIGCTSSFRMIQLLRFSFKPKKIQSEKEVFEYMCTDFVDSVRKCFEEGGFLQKYKDGDEKGGCFMVAFKNRLFTIEEDFQVSESLLNFESIGCGRPYALGAMHANNMKNARLQVESALEAACTFSGGVTPPFNIIEKEIK